VQPLSGWNTEMLLQSNSPSIIIETISPVKSEFVDHITTSVLYCLLPNFMVSFVEEFFSFLCFLLSEYELAIRSFASLTGFPLVTAFNTSEVNCGGPHPTKFIKLRSAHLSSETLKNYHKTLQGLVQHSFSFWILLLCHVQRKNWILFFLIVHNKNGNIFIWNHEQMTIIDNERYIDFKFTENYFFPQSWSKLKKARFTNVIFRPEEFRKSFSLMSSFIHHIEKKNLFGR